MLIINFKPDIGATTTKAPSNLSFHLHEGTPEIIRDQLVI